jgi:hypothetical protein
MQFGALASSAEQNSGALLTRLRTSVADISFLM